MSNKITDEMVSAGARALWDSDDQNILERYGYPSDWDSQPEPVKQSLKRRVRLVLNAANEARGDDHE